LRRGKATISVGDSIIELKLLRCWTVVLLFLGKGKINRDNHGGSSFEKEGRGPLTHHSSAGKRTLNGKKKNSPLPKKSGASPSMKNKEGPL